MIWDLTCKYMSRCDMLQHILLWSYSHFQNLPRFLMRYIHIYIYSSYMLGISHPRDWPPEIAEPQHSQLCLAQERGQRLQLLDKRQRWRDWRPRRPLPKRDPIYFHCWEIIRYPLKIQLFIWLSRSEIDRKLMEFLMFFCLVEADSQFTQSESIRRVGFVPPQAAWNVWNVWNVLHFFQ